MSSKKSHLEEKVPELGKILDRFKEQMRERGDTQRSLAAKIRCHSGQLSKSLAGYVLPSANILFGAARQGYDMNYIMKGEKGLDEKWAEEKKLLLYHVDRLESLLIKKQQ